MEEPLRCSEEIKGELPFLFFFMLAHLLWVGSLVLGHKENGVFMSPFLRAHICEVIKLHLQLVY